MNRAVRRLLLAGQDAGATDAQLLERFVARRDEAAFAALVRRHGPMVLGVCRRTAGHAQDAEDAFQATFLVLARKAASLRAPARLAAWLYGVAFRTARKARAAADRLRGRERQVSKMPQPLVEDDVPWQDVSPRIDLELSRLPDRYRVPIILCDLQGKTRKEAARQLGVPEGTLSSRLATARRTLARRLARYGLAVSGGAVAAALARQATAAVPAALADATARAASGAAACLVSAKVAALTEGVMKAMLWAKLKVAAVMVLAASAVVAGAGLTALGPGSARATDGKADAPQVRAPDDKAAVWMLDFKFKDPRLITVDLPGKGKKTVWYLSYTVANPTDEEHRFVPDFELTIPDKEVHHDWTPPVAVRDFIEQAEDPTGTAGRVHLKGSVTIAADPIPPAKSVSGVATWDDVDPDLQHCCIYVYGLSNGWTADDSGMVRRKTLELEFKRVGGDMQLIGSPQWLYIPSHGGKSERARDPDDPDELRRTIADLRKQLGQAKAAAAVTDPQKALAEKEAEIAALRDQLTASQIEVKALIERCKALQEKIAEMEKEKDKEKGKKDEKPAGAPGNVPPIEGMVKQAADGLVTISVGSDAGVEKGMWLDVFRLNPPVYLGRLQIIDVTPTEAVGKPMGPPSAKTIQPGDLVTTNIKTKGI
jgi:RNA polymerase sigma factor (sigma-70 family)